MKQLYWSYNTHTHTGSHSPFPGAEVYNDEALILIGVYVVKDVESWRSELVAAQITSWVLSGQVEPCLWHIHTRLYEQKCTGTHM